MTTQKQSVEKVKGEIRLICFTALPGRLHLGLYTFANKRQLWLVGPGWTRGAHQSHSITPPPQQDRGDKI